MELTIPTWIVYTLGGVASVAGLAAFIALVGLVLWLGELALAFLFRKLGVWRAAICFVLAYAKGARYRKGVLTWPNGGEQDVVVFSGGWPTKLPSEAYRGTVSMDKERT